MFDDDEDESGQEVEVMIVAREEVLEKLGIDPEAFEEALPDAIDKYHDMVEALDDEADAPPLEDMAVQIGERAFRQAGEHQVVQKNGVVGDGEAGDPVDVGRRVQRGVEDEAVRAASTADSVVAAPADDAVAKWAADDRVVAVTAVG